ncbi:MAG: hypothetical protein ACMG6H_04255 [Acidobacteriota bacterium]
MHRKDLKELAGDPNFISGIYNYCDRWCERCPFTARCLVYATEKADEELGDPDTHDINNEKFWRKLEGIFRETRELIREWAEEAGVDLDAAEAEAAQAEHEQERDEAKQHQLSEWARDYTQMVQRWFEGEFAVEQNVHDDLTGKSRNAGDDINVSDAIEVIRWYQFFIAAKVYRALMGIERGTASDDSAGDEIFEDLEFDLDEADDSAEETDLTEALAEAAGGDSDGSAKIALISIDRSLSAWRVMQSSFAEKTDTIMPMLLELERLRRGMEQLFPQARDFIRPGFDEMQSEFVS